MGQRSDAAVRGWIERLVVLSLASALAWLASATPMALPASAPADRFAAGRAIAAIEALAQVTHPVGSADDIRVGGLIQDRLRTLGLTPQVRVFEHARSWDAPRDPRTYRVADILARVAGRNAALPAVLVMSHYDSVPRSPGAADDMAGVASALEMARLLRLRPPTREVVFAFTDGEEAGLAGAGALLSDPAFVHRIGVVINMDVRGGGGRALMFQTGRLAGGLQRLYAAHAVGPNGNSLAAYLYDVLSNDTDFTVALAHGMTGLNYAFIGRPELYHTPAAVPGAVEAGAVQSLGGQVWAMVRSLADSPNLPPPGPDLTWFDLLGQGVVIYPPALGWLPTVAIALLLLLVVARQGPDWSRTAGAVLAGAARSLSATALAAALLYAYGAVCLHGYYADLAQAPWTEAVTAVACLGAALLALRARGPAASPLGPWTGAVLVAWLIALGLQALAPRTAFVAQWPTLLAAVALATAALRAKGARWIALGCAVASLGFLLEIGHMLVLAVGVTLPAVGAVILPLVLAGLAPFLHPDRSTAADRRRAGSSHRQAMI